MKPTQLRAWVKRGGVLGVLVVAVLLGLHDLWYRKRNALVVVIALSLLGTTVFLLRPHHPSNVDAVSHPPSIPPRTIAVEPMEPEGWKEPLIFHYVRGGFCADVEEYGPDKGTLIQVRIIKNGSILWQRMSKDAQRLEDLKWSNDGRSLIFIEDCGDPWRVVLWNTNGVAQVFDSPALSDCLADSSQIIAWSPDNARLLLRSFISGGLDSNSGTLWCFHVRTGRIHEISDCVRRAEWIGRRQVRYWVTEGDTPWIRDEREPDRPDREVPDVVKTPKRWICTLP